MDETKQIDAKTFWRALGARATGVVVATARGLDGPAGFLALSATHVTADPPTMLVSIDKRTAALAAVLSARHFALNFLAAGDRALADMFGGRGETRGADRFAPDRWGTLVTGAPILNDAVGAIDCALAETIERAGVVIAIGRVVDVVVRDGEPLLFFRGAYR
ncbi:MAG TPA: flavin reductase family protein [Xanthobacteraceae bacterium]|nr:flavin reductase family protein [Xanthobacteraceae bacterium]